ncbi:MAG: hypothetical protein J5494_05170, partial [Candidatus Methanomethylophilaceae archaeon]|nr:hypothetical protein [Candidatus Methanomethylophilaceae archaeon]
MQDDLNQIAEEAKELLSEKKYAKLYGIIKEMMPADIALLFEELPIEDVTLLFRLLPKTLAADTFVEMDSEQQKKL